jgi:3-hydroxyisobutyrate dehydrogenase
MERSMSSNETVAVLGTGIMGAPMARNLLAAGIPVRVWNRTPEKTAPLGASGAVIGATPAEAAAGAPVVLTMLTDADAVLEVAGAALDGAEVWIQASTVGIEGGERCAALAAERGVAYVDAPVLGTRQPAEEGKLVVLASGPDEVRERIAPVFDAVAARTWWLGEAGGGQRMKLVANTWVLALVEGLAETLQLAEGLGVPPQQFLDVIAGGPLDAGYAQAKGKGMIEREFAPAFPLRHALKDLRLVEDAAERHELYVPLVTAIAERFAQGVAVGNGDLDMSATFLTGR